VLERDIQISSSTILAVIDMEFKNGKAGVEMIVPL